MTSVHDITMLPSLLNVDPIVVQRLRRMRQVRQPAQKVDIFTRWDNRLRDKIDDVSCMRRYKYITRLGLYYWNHLRDTNCEDCCRHNESGWATNEQADIVMMKSNRQKGRGLDFTRASLGRPLESSCMESFLATTRRIKKSQSDRASNYGAGEGYDEALVIALRDYDAVAAEMECDAADFEEFMHMEVENFAPADDNSVCEMQTVAEQQSNECLQNIRTARKATVKLSSSKLTVLMRQRSINDQKLSGRRARTQLSA